MNNIQIIIATIALIVATWALFLQKKEIIKNGKINSLIHMTNKIQNKIDFHNGIINDLKANGGVWKGHADKINDVLRPLQQNIDNELYKLIEKYEGLSNIREVREKLTT